LSLRRLLLAAAVALLGAGVAAGLAARHLLSPSDPAGESVVFEVEPGEALGSIARRLESQGLVRSRLAFEALARWRRQSGSLQKGEYRLSAAMAPGAILEAIVRGRVVTYEVALPEGFTAEQIADRLAAVRLVERDAFLRVVRSAESARQLGVEGDGLEGYLFPETYRLPRGLAPLELARVLVEQFHAVWAPLAPLARRGDFSMRDVVTLASIVEKETGVPEERPLIASVFLNRLERGMRLESDPTVIYGIPDFDGNLRRRDLVSKDNPYNTYRIFGLPPGPIAFPGEDALRAVVSPADSPYLYFVSRNDGTHVFSRTYREHVNAVNRYQRRGRRPAPAGGPADPAEGAQGP
jgi:UPF0755 protein